MNPYIKSKFGLCLLSIIPVRAEPKDQAEIVTQMLLGESCTILSQNSMGNWVKVKSDIDGYEGWIDPKQIVYIAEGEYLKYLSYPIAVVKGGNGMLRIGAEFRNVVQGSPLRFSNVALLKNEDMGFEFEGDVFTAQQDAVVNVALGYLGVPYLWGGKTIFGIDCSGFVQQVYLANGIKLPRDAYQQAEIGEGVKFGEHLAGDIAYFKNAKGKITHVGIVLNGQKIIHAHGQVRIDDLREEGIWNEEIQTITHKYSHTKRLHF